VEKIAGRESFRTPHKSDNVCEKEVTQTPGEKEYELKDMKTLFPFSKSSH
jgi:hypothetical protein